MLYFHYLILLIALSDIHGNFILNGNFVVSMSKREINIQGAIFEYSGSNNTIERINSTDRIEEELTLQVHVYFFHKFENSLYMIIIFIILCSNSLKNSYHFISIKVLCVGNLHNPDVRYSFNIPIEDGSDLFTWDPYGPWQDCSRMCQGTVNSFVTRTKDLVAFRKGLVLSTQIFHPYF